MKSNRWTLSYYFFGLILAGCLATASTPATQSTDTVSVESSIIPSPSNTSSLPAWCMDLKQENGLPASDVVRNSYIVYEAFAFNDENHEHPVWAVSLSDGSETLLTGDFPASRFGNSVYDAMGNGFFLHSSDEKHIAIWEYRFDPGASDPEEISPLVIRNKDSNQDIVVFSSGPGETIHGNWSPDGNQFAFTWYKNIPEYYSVVYSVNADGTELIELAGHIAKETLERPYWSPDGTKIAIPVFAGGIIIVIDVQSGNMNRFEVSPIVRFRPSTVYELKPDSVMAWSSDSQWFAYISQYEHQGVEILNVENGNVYCVENKDIRGVEKLVWLNENP